MRGWRFGARSALRNLSVKGASQVAERVCRMLVVIVSAGVLGDAAFGRFVFASTVTFLLALGTDLGTGVWTTRELARDRTRADDVVRVSLSLRMAASWPYAVVVAALAGFLMRGEDRAAIALLGIAALANVFVDYLSAILRGFERFVDEARLNGLRALATTAAGLGGLFAYRALWALCAGLAAASVACMVCGGLVVWRLDPDAWRGARERPLDRTLAHVALRQSLPIWLAGLVSLLYFKVDTVFLKFLAGDAELGTYGAAYKFFEGSMILPSVLLSVAFPQLSRAYGRPRAQRATERGLAALLLSLGAFAGLVCLAGARGLVHVVFGAEFERAVVPLRVLSLGLPLVYLNFGLTHFLLARDRGRATLLLALMMLGLNVTLDAALIPHHQGVGAAWATVLSEVALTFGCFGFLWLEVRAPRPPSVRGVARTGQKAV